MAFQTDRRFAHIDCLRAVGALTVFFHHIFPGAVNRLGDIGGIAKTLVSYDHYLDSGRFGVNLFFIVSGWVIPYSLLGRDGGRTASFVINRAFRLYPMYWIAITLVLLSTGSGGTGYEALFNYTLLHRFFGISDVLGLAWTLQVELFFYFLTASLFVSRLLQRPSYMLGIAAVLICWHVLVPVIVGLSGPRLPVGWTTFLTLMFCGTVLRFADEDMVPRRTAVLLVLSFIPARLAVALAIVDFQWQSMTWLPEFLPVALPIVTFIVVNSCKTPNWRPLAWIGTISYSLYLLHPLIAPPALVAMSQSDWFHDRPFTATFLALLVVVSVSSVTFLAVERPCIRLGRKLAARSRLPLRQLA